MMRKIAKQVKTKEDEPGTIQKMMEKEFEGNLYRTYTFMDLLSLVHIRSKLKREEKLFIKDHTILNVYQGHTIFSIF